MESNETRHLIDGDPWKEQEAQGMHVPAEQEENCGASFVATVADRLPAAEAAAGRHYEDLARHQEQE